MAFAKKSRGKSKSMFIVLLNTKNNCARLTLDVYGEFASGMKIVQIMVRKINTINVGVSLEWEISFSIHSVD